VITKMNRRCAMDLTTEDYEVLEHLYNRRPFDAHQLLTRIKLMLSADRADGEMMFAREDAAQDARSRLKV
jgi:hypothetical protein